MSELLEHYRRNLRSIQGEQRGDIVLHCGNGHTLQMFFVDSGALPPNTFDAEMKTGTAHARFAMYPHYVDLVRNEGPCRVSFNRGPSFACKAAWRSREKTTRVKKLVPVSINGSVCDLGGLAGRA